MDDNKGHWEVVIPSEGLSAKEFGLDDQLEWFCSFLLDS